MQHRLTYGNETLGRTGLVAFTRCGHWWAYPATRPDAEQLHELARFNLGIACSFCLAAWHDARHARAGGTAWRLNGVCPALRPRPVEDTAPRPPYDSPAHPGIRGAPAV